MFIRNFTYLTYSVLLVLLTNLKENFAIYTPDDLHPKPTKYTSGIKTSFNPNALYFHHNYSKVMVNNDPSRTHLAKKVYFVSKDDEKDETKQKFYPVYNGHTYGQKPQVGEALTKKKVIKNYNNRHLNNTREENIRELKESLKNEKVMIVSNKRKKEISKQIEVYSKCPEGVTGQFIYDLSCNQYLNCWRGRGTVQNCAPGTLFNPKTLECDYPNKVECITGPRQNTINVRQSKSEKIVDQTKCPSGFTGLIPNYSDCAKFINCNNGAEFHLDCPPGTLFDMTQNVCDHAYKSICYNGENRKNIKNTPQHHTNQQYGQESAYNNNQAYTGEQTNGQIYQQHHQTYEQANNYGTQGKICHTNCHANGQQLNGQVYSGYPQTNGQIYSGNQYNSQVSHGSSIPNGNQNGYQTTSHKTYQTQYGNGQNTNGYKQISQGTFQTNYNENAQRVHGNTQGINGKLDFNQNQKGNCDGNTNCGQNYNQFGSQNFDKNTQQSGSNYGQNNGQLDVNNNCNTNINPNCQQSQNTQNTNQGGYSYTNTQFSAQNGQNIPYQSSSQQGYVPDQNPYGSTNVEINSGRNCNKNINPNCGQINQNINENSQQYGYTNTQFSSQNGQNIPYQSSSQQGYVPDQKPYGSTNIQIISGQNNEQNCNKNINPNCGQNNQDFNRHSQHGYTNTQFSVQNGQNGQNTAHQSSSQHGYISNQNSYGRTNVKPGQTNPQNFRKVCNINDKTCQNRKTQNAKPECPSGFSGVTKHPTDCKKFLNCANGITYIQDCGPGTAFNPVINNCDYPYNVKCEVEPGNEYNSGNQNSENNSGTDVYQEENITTDKNIQGNLDWKQEIPSAQYTQATYDYGTNNKLNNNDENSYLGEHTNRNPTGDTFKGQKSVIMTPHPYFTTHSPIHVSESYQISPTNQIDDKIENPNVYQQKNKHGTITKSWPPSFPSTDVNADYIYEYEDIPEDDDVEVFDPKPKFNKKCTDDDFHCNYETCVSKTSVCDGRRDCKNGKDEQDCQQYIQKFTPYKQHMLLNSEKQRWNNVSHTTCAILCLETTTFECRSFNYRTVDRTCFLSDSNIGLSGMLMGYYPCDFYERKSHVIDCTDLYKCSNGKCLSQEQICDGFDDCGDRMDEKNCGDMDFGYDIRLEGSEHPHEGRIVVTGKEDITDKYYFKRNTLPAHLEIAFNKTGFVCDDQFGLRDANVVCKELGYPLGAAEVRGQSQFSQNLKENNTFYMMDDVKCLGNETSLKECDFSGWGVHKCMDQEIVGVVCKIPQETCPENYWQCDNRKECLPLAFVCDGLYDCTDNSDEASHHCEVPIKLRLKGGTSGNEGRLEIKYNGVWGTVCDDDFNDDAAKVVCRKMGYKGVSSVKKDAYFGKGDGPIWLDQVSCFGNETSLENCSHWNWGEHNCDHGEDVGIICSDIDMDERHNSNNVPPTENPVSSPIYPESCGNRKDNIFSLNDDVHFRVVKGTKAKPGDYPWQAALKVKTKGKPAHWCGAVVISSKFVLTAAHCLVGYAKGAYLVVAGDYNVDEKEGTEQTDFIEEYFIHDKFRIGHKMNNDIAVVKLKRGFKLNQDIQPLCLPDEDTEYETETNCTISGFGSVQSGSSEYSHDMRAGWVPIQSDEVCKMPHVYGSALTEGMFCAGSLDEGIDACDGDSGGPLACLKNGYFTLFGITSWGHRCGYANKPGVYVKVSYYKSWIDDIMRKHND